jgi:copper chaperone
MKFKTNIRCGGCIANVKPKLESIPGVKEWSVDLDSPDRTLTVEGENLDEKKITEALISAGYQGVKIS